MALCRTIALLFVVVLAIIASLAHFLLGYTLDDAGYLIAWIVAQWIPINDVRVAFQEKAWSYWEDGQYASRLGSATTNGSSRRSLQQMIPSVDVQLHKDNLNNYLEETYGKDWQKRPLLLRNLWTSQELANPTRRLSVTGLLNETNFTIPYFTDARLDNALSPDGSATLASIVANMSKGMPHKIGTQLVIQKSPELVLEVAPTEILTELFGDYFTPDHVKGTMGPWLPALTTVPLFVASTAHLSSRNRRKILEESEDKSEPTKEDRQSFTALHCEPIGNVAVQLAGAKQWTLVDPAFSFLIRPGTAPDGRAFFASWKPIQSFVGPKKTEDSDTNHQEQQGSNQDNDDVAKVPFYTATTYAGDAM